MVRISITNNPKLAEKKIDEGNLCIMKFGPVYGIFCKDDKSSMQKLCSLKKRSETKTLVYVGSKDQLGVFLKDKRLARMRNVNDMSEFLRRLLAFGPVGILLNIADQSTPLDLAIGMTDSGEKKVKTLGFMISMENDDFNHVSMQHGGKLLRGTSANLSGKSQSGSGSDSLYDLISLFGNSADVFFYVSEPLVKRYQDEKVLNGISTTIIHCSEVAEGTAIEIVREGSVSKALIMSTAGHFPSVITVGMGERTARISPYMRSPLELAKDKDIFDLLDALDNKINGHHGDKELLQLDVIL